MSPSFVLVDREQCKIQISVTDITVNYLLTIVLTLFEIFYHKIRINMYEYILRTTKRLSALGVVSSIALCPSS